MNEGPTPRRGIWIAVGIIVVGLLATAGLSFYLRRAVVERFRATTPAFRAAVDAGYWAAGQRIAG